MKRIGALVLAVFVLLLSVESSIGMHFCHDVLVETSINQTLSSCCKKANNQQHMLSKQCCELTQFKAELQETVVAESNVTFSKLITFVPAIQFEVNIFEYVPKQQLIRFESPPEPHHIAVHILFEQYLI
jgi:hypothetical protein